MRLAILTIPLVAAIASGLAAALISTVLGISKWIVIVVAVACAMLSAGSVVAELV